MSKLYVVRVDGYPVYVGISQEDADNFISRYWGDDIRCTVTVVPSFDFRGIVAHDTRDFSPFFMFGRMAASYADVVQEWANLSRSDDYTEASEKLGKACAELVWWLAALCPTDLFDEVQELVNAKTNSGSVLSD